MTQRLTPVDILNLRFRRSLGGYSIADVDEFIRRVASDMEATLTEAAAQRDRLQTMEQEIAQYRALEGTMRDALILAQKTSDETRSAARQQAEAQIREAQARVREIEAQAQARLDAVGAQIERLQQERRQLARRLRAQLTEQLQWLSQELEAPVSDDAGASARAVASLNQSFSGGEAPSPPLAPLPDPLPLLDMPPPTEETNRHSLRQD